MRIHLIAVGNKMPKWVEQGYQEYTKRLGAECRLVLHEVAAAKRVKNALVERMKEEEGGRMLAAIPARAHVVALDLSGKTWSTAQLADQLANWMPAGSDVALLVGGPDGLADACLQRADQRWCLSPLTFPHPLVRVILAEQLYRAWSFYRNHPYHR
ncbi:MAG: 23S rRNA (pseudouridine(1915)-N(3))-methyltransferase RlmH [Gammaproteobacteria bacterium]|nr:23S rRNA (pseudouridine(1915)-N(3))-methyltransferase RlmH [Gammaproteobacteria bacterium]